ncbi:hypothetical protein Tco_1260632, partial [Tanacetum coccineum]
MSTNGQTPLSQPTSVVRNTLSKIPGKAYFRISLGGKYCDRNYHQILPIIAEKVHQEKVQQEKLKAIKARLNFEETSHHSESGTPTRRRGLKERLGPRHIRSRSESPYPRRGRSESPKKKGSERKTATQGVGRTIVATWILKAATKVPNQEQQSPPLRDVITKGHPPEERGSCQKAK